MKTELIHLDEITLVACEHRGPYPLIGPVFEKVIAWAVSNGVKFDSTIGIYNDDPAEVPAEELRSDACLVVGLGFELPAGTPPEFRMVRIPAGKYVMTTHIGSYSKLGETWGKFMSPFGAPSQGRDLDVLCFEWYRNDCSTVAEAELHTDLFVATR